MFKDLMFWKRKNKSAEIPALKNPDTVYVWLTEDGRKVAARLAPMTMRREILAAAALRAMEIQDFSQIVGLGVSIDSVIDGLQKFDKLADLADAVLIREPGCEKDDLLDISHTVIRKVVADFLAFNPKLVNDLGNMLMSRVLNLHLPTRTQPQNRPSA